MIGKWLSKAKQWFKPSNQPHVSATSVATEEASLETEKERIPPDAEKVEEAVDHLNQSTADIPAEKPNPIEDTSSNPVLPSDMADPGSNQTKEIETEKKAADDIDAQSKSETALSSDSPTTFPESGYRIEGDQFHYQSGDFSFSMPVGDEELQVLKDSDAKIKEALDQLGEGNEKQRKHWESKRYWSLQIHYRDRAQHFYKLRDQEPDALAKAISYCEKMIQYAPMAIHANRMDPHAKELPQHYGYKQLAIIREREGNIKEAIRLCNQAMKEGWKGDWSQRIERYRKKLDSSSS